MAELSDGARDRILRATMTLIGRDGAAAVTNRSVAREAGVSLGTLTYHFADQRTLLRSALERFLDDEVVRLAALTAQIGQHELTGPQAALALEAMLNTELERRAAKLELYLRAARDDELRGAAQRCFDAYDALARSALHALSIDGADELAVLLVAVIDGLQLRRLAAGRKAPAVGEALQLLLARLKAGEPL